MASYYAYMSALFDPGAENVEKALEIYEELQERNGACLAVVVEKDGDQLWLHHDQGDGQGDVVGHAVGFVAECARRLDLTGTWSVEWSLDCSRPAVGAYGGGVVAVDLATQAVTCINSEDMLSIAKKKLEEVAAKKAAFPIEIAVKPDISRYSEWLNETVGDNWRHFTRAMTVYDESAVDEEVVLFKTEADAVAFKLRFG